MEVFLALVVTAALCVFVVVGCVVLALGTPGSWATTDDKYKAVLGGLWLFWLTTAAYTVYRLCAHLVDFLIWLV